MQALIDFEGWKRWNGTEKADTKLGFQVGPLRAARNLAGKLHIDRKGTRTPPPARTQSTESNNEPSIHVRSATPQSSLDTSTSPTPIDLPLGSAATSLSAARTDLVGRRPSNPEDAAVAVAAASGPTSVAHTAGSAQPPSRPLSSQAGSGPGRRSPSNSRPTTPRSEGRLSGSSSLRSIHEALEPTIASSPGTEMNTASPAEKPLPPLPTE